MEVHGLVFHDVHLQYQSACCAYQWYNWVSFLSRKQDAQENLDRAGISCLVTESGGSQELPHAVMFLLAAVLVNSRSIQMSGQAVGVPVMQMTCGSSRVRLSLVPGIQYCLAVLLPGSSSSVLCWCSSSNSLSQIFNCSKQCLCI